jgi:hypothetical protein
MVTRLALLLAEQSVWQRLPAIDRARLTMALLAFVVLFIGVIVFVLLVGRIAKREIRKPLPSVRNLNDEWARKPLAEESHSPSADSP